MISLPPTLPMPPVRQDLAKEPPRRTVLQRQSEPLPQQRSLPLLPAMAGSPNPLLRAAQPLLECVPLLKQCAQAPALQDLRDQLIAQVNAFSTQANNAGVPDETVAMARYCLCTLMDEVIADTPWGIDAWGGGGSLLVAFHHEASGGERFFRILQWVAQAPETYIDMLEFIHALLAMGIEGRYRLQEGGRGALARVRERLYLLIRAQRGSAEAPLTPPEQTAVVLPQTKHRRHPSLHAFIALGSILLVGFLACDYWLARQANPLLAALRQDPSLVPLATSVVTPIIAPPASTPSVSPTPTPSPSGLATLLAAEVAKQTISIETRQDRTIITLHVDNLFDSGSAKIRSDNTALLHTIGQALASLPGRIIITGHSDNQATRPGSIDNWGLSQLRAAAVVSILIAQTNQPERFLAQGRGATEPIVDNDTPAHRAQNRRVTITLLAPGSSP